MRRPDLRTAGVVLVGGFVVHNGDHMRRGFDAITDGVAWGGTFVALLAAVVLTLVFTGHPRAPMAAAATGPAIALGVAAAHLLPDWGPLSDSLVSGDVDGFTWVAVFAEIVAAALFGWVGYTIARGHDYAFEIPESKWDAAGTEAASA
jgi:hypothetical protein